MLAYRKHGERRAGIVTAAIGAGLLVERAGSDTGADLVQMHEAENKDEFRAAWLARSQTAARGWQTEDGPLDAGELLQ